MNAPLGAHLFQITVTCVKQRIVGREKNGGGGKKVILSTSTSTQIPNQKTSKKEMT